jgi:hypothetical protein
MWLERISNRERPYCGSRLPAIARPARLPSTPPTPIVDAAVLVGPPTRRIAPLRDTDFARTVHLWTFAPMAVKYPWPRPRHGFASLRGPRGAGFFRFPGTARSAASP